MMTKGQESLNTLYQKYVTDDEFLEDDKLFSTVEVELRAFESIKDLIELVDDENGYGITIKGLYTFKFIPKETYDLLKKVLL